MKKKKMSGSAPMSSKTGKPVVSSGKPAAPSSPSTSGMTGGGMMKKGGMVKKSK